MGADFEKKKRSTWGRSVNRLERSSSLHNSAAEAAPGVSNPLLRNCARHPTLEEASCRCTVAINPPALENAPEPKRLKDLLLYRLLHPPPLCSPLFCEKSVSASSASANPAPLRAGNAKKGRKKVRDPIRLRRCERGKVRLKPCSRLRPPLPGVRTSGRDRPPRPEGKADPRVGFNLKLFKRPPSPPPPSTHPPPTNLRFKF